MLVFTEPHMRLRYILCLEDKNISYPETNQLLTEQTVLSCRSVRYLCCINRLLMIKYYTQISLCFPLFIFLFLSKFP